MRWLLTAHAEGLDFVSPSLPTPRTRPRTRSVQSGPANP